MNDAGRRETRIHPPGVPIAVRSRLQDFADDLRRAAFGRRFRLYDILPKEGACTERESRKSPMAKPRKLPAPPIVEAVLDLRVTFPEPPSMDTLASIAPKLPGYSEANRIRQTSFQFAIAEGKAPTATTTPTFEDGIAYRSADNLYVLQCRRGGMSLSRLPPYIDWQPVFDEMWRAWLAYRAIVKPARVTRVSTRFVNRIDIPTGADLDDYLLIGPRLPEGAPQFVNQFSSVLGIPFEQQKSNAVVRLASAFAASTTTQPVMLDLDILHECDLSPTDDDAIGDAIRALRPLKNQVFFGSLTEKAMELFQ
jgi:uncharacterized protein (TIGR04255 family)